VVHEEQRGRKRRGVASNHLGRVNGTALPLQDLPPAEPRLRAARRTTRSRSSWSARHRHRPVPRLPPRAQGPGCEGQELAVLRQPLRREDFLYREELDELRREGALTRLDTAFSRDQAEKVYVQHRILEAGPDLWSWLNEGAHVYVCGDAKRMASDVDKALREIAARHGGMDEAGAKAWLKQLADVGRYQRDVY
jgi:sulfite reductase alpha subunit-like flavoprotein